MQHERLDDEHGATPPASGTGWLADALAAAGACAWRWNADSDALQFTGEAADLFGALPATLGALDVLVHREDQSARFVARTRAIIRGETWYATFRVSAKAGVRWIEERGRAFLDEGGHPVVAVALAFDVTSRHGAEQSLEQRLERESHQRGSAESAMHALADSEAFLESIFASMADGLVLYGTGGRVTRINPAAREMLGCGGAAAQDREDPLLTTVVVSDVEGRPVPRNRLPSVAALRGESIRGVPLAFQRPDGEKVWATVGAAPMRTLDGSIIGAVLSLGDVSRLRDLQEQREDLARMISHDLRAPLGVILGHAKRLGRRAESLEMVRSRTDAIVTSAQRMASMLNDLVETALLETGKLRLDLSPVDLGALVRAVCGRLPAPRDGERIRIEVAGGVPQVLADSERLERIVVNLLTNALKYSAPGTEVLVRIAASGEWITVEVEDHGQGIAPEDVPHLFERFYRAAGSCRFEGMGLGLYTAQMLAEAHGGAIEVSTVAGKGSVFRVRLPVQHRER